MTPAQAAEILGCDVGATEAQIKEAFAGAVRSVHPDVVADGVAHWFKAWHPEPPPSLATIKQARDVLLKREATCPYCRGTGWQSVGLRRQRCVKGCDESA